MAPKLKYQRITTTDVVIDVICGIVFIILILLSSSILIKYLLGTYTFVNLKLPISLPFIDSFTVPAKYVPWVALVFLIGCVKGVVNAYNRIEQYIKNKKK